MARKAPKWFTEAVRAERSTWYGDKAGQQAAADRLAALALANPDQRFAASIIADWARVAIAEKRLGGWRSAGAKDSNASQAAELRDGGMSNRQIAKVLGIGEATVRRDLARWDADRANVTDLRPESPADHSPGVWSARVGGKRVDPSTARQSSAPVPSEMAQPTDAPESENNIIQIRRSS